MAVLFFTYAIYLGFLISLAQWIILRKYSIRLYKWSIVTIFGYMISILLLGVLQLEVYNLSSVFLHSLIVAVVLGFMQFLVLRQKFIKSGYWIIAIFLAWFFMDLITMLLFKDIRPRENLLFIVVNGVNGLIFGSITGIFLIRLIQLNEQTTDK